MSVWATLLEPDHVHTFSRRTDNEGCHVTLVCQECGRVEFHQGYWDVKLLERYGPRDPRKVNEWKDEVRRTMGLPLGVAI